MITKCYKLRDAKSLVKHLLVADLTKRYGNLKGGANDIKSHRWFAQMDWDHLIQKKQVPIFKPVVKYIALLITLELRVMPPTIPLILILPNFLNP